MVTVERRITGGDVQATAIARLASRPAQGKLQWPLENPKHHIVESFPRLISSLPSVRFNPFDGKLHLATYVPERSNPENTVKRWSKFMDLESITGAAVEIFTRYEPAHGPLVNATRKLIAFSQDKGEVFRNRRVQTEELDEFMQEASKVLEDCGLRQPILPLKDKVRVQILAGLSPDSQNRRNPLIARTRLISAVVKLFMIEQIQSKVAQKYLELFAYLLPEYELERTLTQEILQELQDQNSDLRTLHTMGDDIHSPVKSAPWRAPLMQAYFGIFANGKKSLDSRFFVNKDPLLGKIKRSAIENYKPELIAAIEQSLKDGINIYASSSV